MHTTVNPRRFMGQEMVLAPLSRGQSAVLLAGFRIGRVSHVAGTAGKSSWLWSMTGPHCSAALSALPMCGETNSLANAKLELRHSFDQWLRWAVEQDGPVYWHWTEAAPARSVTSDESHQMAASG